MNIDYSKIISLGHIWGLHNSLFYPNQFYSVIEEESVNFESRLEELINLSQNISSVSDGYESEDERDYDDLLDDLNDRNIDEVSSFNDDKCKSVAQDSEILGENLSFDDKLLLSISNPDTDKCSDNFLNFYKSVNFEYHNGFQNETKDKDNLFNLNTSEGIKFSSKKRLTNECAEAYDSLDSKRKKFSDEDTKVSVKADASK